MVLNPALWPHENETPQEREGRVRRLAELVRSGQYDVQAQRLALALLDWDPRRGAPKQSVEVADRRRAYMREYMRRRRAEQLLRTATTRAAEILEDPPGD